MDAASIRRKRKEYIVPALTHLYDESIVIDRAKGAYVYDTDGRQYLDFFGGILTVQVGHSNEHVTGAIKEQLDKVQHTTTLYDTAPMVKTAEKLAAITPGEIQKTLFTNSGTEANEAAVVMAQAFTGHQEILALRHSYHGRSQIAMALTGQAPWRRGGSSLPGIKHVMAPYCYRCPLGLEHPDCGLACVRDIEDVIQTTTVGRVAGMIAEPILGVGGFITPPDDYYKEAAAIVRSYGGIFIADEVQTGFGRTGDFMFGIQHWGVEPEIMTFAKGFANGAPIGATAATGPVADALQPPTISTFGGNPITMVAAYATVQYIEEHHIVNNAGEMGRRLRAGLEALQDKYPEIGDVRGKGLMQGLELVYDPATKEPAPELVDAFLGAAKERNLLLGKGGLFNNAVRITPPLTVGPAEVDEALKVMDAAMGDAVRRVGRRE